jgi:hypothetical protein
MRLRRTAMTVPAVAARARPAHAADLTFTNDAGAALGFFGASFPTCYGRENT